MKITKVTPYIMWGGDAGKKQYSSTMWGQGAGRNWMFVKVETDAGIHGWGEGSLVNQTKTIAEAVNAIAPQQLIGQDARDIERLWQIMFLHSRYRGGVIINSALSAIDQALWDIKGKALGVPVYQLLGGAVRNKIRVYAGAGDAANAKQRVAEGFSGVKAGAWYTDKDIDERKVVAAFRESVAELREAIGPDVDLMIDNHGRSRPSLAIRQMCAVEEFNLLFFEEPVPPDNTDCYALLRQSGVRMDIAAGERLLNRWQYKDIIQRQLVDVIQPDICHCGGISELRRIAAMAEVYCIQVAPHNPKGPIATAASLHVCATIPNFLTLEHAHANPLFDEIQVEPMRISNGYYPLPTKPGLGVDLNEEVIAAHPYKYRPVIQAFWDDGTPAHP